jgi:hypothetical protein
MYGTNFTWKQVHNKYHKLKREWKLIMEAKAANGASFDDVQKKIIYDDVEVVKMKAVRIYVKYLYDINYSCKQGCILMVFLGKCRMVTREPSTTMFQFPCLMRWSLSSLENMLLESLVFFKYHLITQQGKRMILLGM